MDGFATTETKRYAFFAIITKDKSTTYVKLDEGQSLSVSDFEVGGVTLEKGLKGYIYGERGVWRPGDTLHIAFMLNDNEVNSKNRTLLNSNFLTLEEN